MGSKRKAVNSVPIVPAEGIEQVIFLIRRQKVMLDADLARLYGVETGALNRAVKRNRKRFPADFMFRLTRKEFENLKCQIGTSSQWGGRRTMPYAFTEHGAVMAASVLNTPRAIKASVYVVRAFVKLRELLSSHKELERKLQELESKLDTHDEAIKGIIATLRELMKPSTDKEKREIGFRARSRSPSSKRKAKARKGRK